MGAGFSTIPENRKPIVTATVAPAACPPPYNKPAANGDRYRWANYNYPENRAPVCATFPPVVSNPSTNDMAVPSYANNTKTSSAAAVDGGGAGGFLAKAANNKEVIVFHSATKWKEYFEASKQTNKLVVIYFTATWCGPCRYMEPTIKELAAKYPEIDLVKIDVDELLNVSREYGVQAMPAFVLMKKGKVIDKVVGARKEDLQRKVENNKA